MAETSDLTITSLRGGLNDTDAPNALADDECTVATNVEFFSSMLGERRNGCGPLTITSSGLDAEGETCHISQWFPTNKIDTPEFWAIACTPGVSAVWARRDINGVWSAVVPGDPLHFDAPGVYEVQTQALNGKYFFAYRSAQDRLHLWNGTTFRRTGLAQPAPLTAIDDGLGTFTSIRYYRIRYVEQVSGVVVRRSEPSTTLTFTPSTTGSGAEITRPALLSEGETHWELEASLNNADFYKHSVQVTNTTTVWDTTLHTVGYAAGLLSESIGTYQLQKSAKFLTVDGDRLITGGHWTDTTLQSTVTWSPVQNDPGVGDDERLPFGINNTITLDNYDGGGLTGIVSSTYGSWYAFKWAGIYKFVRTGDLERAYDVITISKTSGAIPGSLVRAVDKSGATYIYFLDPVLGPSRIGPGGLQVIRGIRKTWGRVYLQAASIVARGLFYPFKQQIHWWVAVDGSDTPNLKLILQSSELQPLGPGEVGKGWSLATGRITEARAVAILTEKVSINSVTRSSTRPFIGLTSPDDIQRCDTERTDAGIEYVATVRTHPFLLTGLLRNWGAMEAAVLAVANASYSILVKFIRDFGTETNTLKSAASLAPVGAETLVIKDFDDLVMSEARSIQVEFTDPE